MVRRPQRLAEATPGKLDMPAVIALCIVNLNDACQGNIVWPFLPFAVQHWGWHGNDVAVGVGLLASSFFIAQTFSFIVWGALADRIGRRPCLIWGTLGVAASMVVFALADNFSMAVAARFLTGILSGNSAISKGYMAEISDKTTAARAFSYLSFVWGFGSIVAPALGGYLAEPATQYPSVFGGFPLLVHYPYALPSLVSVGVSLTAFVVGFFALPETGAFVRRREARLRAAAAAAAAAARGEHGAHELEMTRLVGSGSRRRRGGGDHHQDDDHGGHHHASDEDDHGHHHTAVDVSAGAAAAGVEAAAAAAGVKAKTSPPPRRPASKQPVKARGGGKQSTAAAAASAPTPPAAPTRQPVPAMLMASPDDADVKPILALEEDVVDTTAVLPSAFPGSAGGGGSASSSSSAPSSTPATAAQLPSSGADDVSLSVVLRDRVVVGSIGLYVILACCQILFDELLSVFAETPREDGGLGFQAQQIGRILLFQGGAQILSQLTFVPRLVTSAGPIACFRNTMWPLAALAAFPALGRLSGSPAALWPALGLFVAFKAVNMSVAFTSIGLVTNNSTRGRALGAVNGVSMSAASLVRAIGPTVGGGLYSASLGWGASLGPWRLHVVYVLQAAFALLGWALSYRLPAWVDTPPDLGPAAAADNGDGTSVGNEAAAGAHTHEDGDAPSASASSGSNAVEGGGGVLGSPAPPARAVTTEAAPPALRAGRTPVLRAAAATTPVSGRSPALRAAPTPLGGRTPVLKPGATPKAQPQQLGLSSSSVTPSSSTSSDGSSSGAELLNHDAPAGGSDSDDHHDDDVIHEHVSLVARRRTHTDPAGGGEV